MEDQYILILGAGLMQRPAIEAAKNLGYKTFIVDGNPNAVCVPFVDKFEPIDLKDKDKIAELALSLKGNLAAVFTAGTDFSTTVSYVAEKCKLPSHTYKASCNASNKIKMRECFKKENVPSPNFQEVERSKITTLLVPEVLNNMKFPKVVKPIDNMGARGCRMIRDKSEFLPAVEDAVRNSKSGKAILEDYMKGDEFSIDALVFNNTITITGFADRHIFYEPYFIETGHTIPTAIDEKKKYELIECFAKGIHSLGLTCGAAKADIKYTENGPMIGEIAARLSGGFMSGWTYPFASGLDLTEQALLIALGKEPESMLQRRKPLPIKDSEYGIYEVPCMKTSAERAWISIPGTVEVLLGTNQVSAMPYSRNILIRNLPGSEAVFPRNNVEKCGNIIAVAKKRELAVNTAENAVAEIVLRLKRNNPTTDNFLEGIELPAEKKFPPNAYDLPNDVNEKLNNYINSLGNKMIGANECVEPLIPECLTELSSSIKDFNHRSIRLSLQLFDKICKSHPDLEEKIFWKDLIRGGVQGIIYYSDCLSNEKKR
ncbi:MAG: ATP-grasp domain-containing protein [Treponema sp.]